MSTFRKDQTGFSAVEAVLILVIVGILGFTGWYVWHAKQAADKSLTSTGSSFVTPKTTKKSTTGQTTPATTTTTTPASQTTKTKTKTSGGTTTTTTTQPQTRTISFTKGGQGQQGSAVIIDGYLSESQTGKCTYSFSLNGTQKLSEDSAISGSNDCHILISSDDFPQSGTYSFTIHFVSSDGLVTATQSANTVDVDKSNPGA